MAYYPGSFNYSTPQGQYSFAASMPDWMSNPTPMLEQLLAARTRARLAEQQPALDLSRYTFDTGTAEEARQFNLQNQLAGRGVSLQELQANRGEQQQQFQNRLAQDEINWQRSHPPISPADEARGFAFVNQFTPRPLPSYSMITPNTGNTFYEQVYNSRNPVNLATLQVPQSERRNRYVSPYAGYFR